MTYTFNHTTNMIIRDDGVFIPMDFGNKDYQDYLTWVSEGNIASIYEEPVVKVTTVTPRQARIALLNAGLLDQVETAVTQAGGATKITWDYATEVNRNDPMIAAVAQALNLTDDQIDNLFTAASTL